MPGALELAKDIEAGRLTPGKLLETCLEAIAAREGEIKAFAALDAAGARKKVAGLAGKGGLFGLPVGIKDIIDTARLPTRHGSPLYEDNQPRADAAVVVQIEDAGGLVIGKTVTTEFAFLNPAPTFNPHHAGRTPGGSSSGSAAGVAAGFFPLALGTQTGGSVIRPASFCGVAAMKPSYRLLPMTGVKPFAPLLDTLGLFGARVVDVAFGLAAITGRDLRVDDRDFGVPHVGISRFSFLGAAETGGIAAFDRAVQALTAAGARVTALETPEIFKEAQAAHGVINAYEAGQALGFEHRHHGAALSPILRATLDQGHAIAPEAYDKARGIAHQARKAARDFLGPVDVFLTYSAPGAAPTRETTGDPRFNKLVTLLGLPAVNVPVFKDEDGLPVGIQVVGAFGKDQRTLAAAAFLEAALA